MKVKLLRRLRKNIRISDFNHDFYDLEMYYNFKWRRQGSYHYMSELLKDVHAIIRSKIYYKINKNYDKKRIY